MTDIYKQNILEHSKNPENYGALNDPSVIQEEFNPVCGDKIILYLFVKDGVVADIKFQGGGCAISQATMSMLTGLVKGNSVVDVLKITKEDILKLLNVDLGPARLKCALLGWQALMNGLKRVKPLA